MEDLGENHCDLGEGTIGEPAPEGQKITYNFHCIELPAHSYDGKQIDF